MLNLYIDFDGVIMNTIDVSYKMIKKQNIDLNNHEEVQQFYQNLNWKKLLEQSTEINNSFSCIQKIMDSNKFNVSI